MRILALSTLLAAMAAPAAAEDAALVFGTARYTDLPRLAQGADVAAESVTAALGAAGFAVLGAADGTNGDLRGLARGFAREAVTADRLVAALVGRFATDGRQSWYLARDAAVPDIISVVVRSQPVETVLTLLAAAPGHSVLLLGLDQDDTVYDDFLRAGIGDLDIPQGVTVITGSPAEITRLLRDTVASPGADLIAAAAGSRRLKLSGYVPDRLVMTAPGQPVLAPETASDDSARDRALWEQVSAADTAQAYARYIDSFPAGQFAAAAQARLAAIRAEPDRAERLAEEALGLDADARRAVQRDLNVLNFNTRGIDGIFGPGTRSAITNWQQQNGYAQTGYLTAEQIGRLDGQAARRAAEREAEAARQRAAEEARDRAFWDETGADRTEAGFRTYLGRYPDGIFAAEASAELARIESARRAQAAAADRAAWDIASAAQTAEAYRRYLDQNPNGAFRQEAQARLIALEQSDTGAAAEQRARAVEQSLNLDPISLRLIEARLQQLGLEPGAVDGRLDRDSRRAIRRYQRDRNLDRTGYLDQATVSQMLTDAFR